MGGMGEMIECSRDLAIHWPKLLAAQGLSTRAEPGDVCGVVYDDDHEVVVTFKEASDGSMYCTLTLIGNRKIEMALANSLLASSATSARRLTYMRHVAVLIGFPCGPGLPIWNEAVEGLARFVPDEGTSASATEFPRGLLMGGTGTVEFATGPAYDLEAADMTLYLELGIPGETGTYRNREEKEFLEAVAERLENLGGRVVVGWSLTQPCAVYGSVGPYREAWRKKGGWED